MRSDRVSRVLFRSKLLSLFSSRSARICGSLVCPSTFVRRHSRLFSSASTPSTSAFRRRSRRRQRRRYSPPLVLSCKTTGRSRGRATARRSAAIETRGGFGESASWRATPMRRRSVLLCPRLRRPRGYPRQRDWQRISVMASLIPATIKDRPQANSSERSRSFRLSFARTVKLERG